MNSRVDSGYPALLHTRQAQPVKGHYLLQLHKLDMWATLYYSRVTPWMVACINCSAAFLASGASKTT